MADVMEQTYHELDTFIAGLIETELGNMDSSRAAHIRSEASRLARDGGGDASEELANIVVGNANVMSENQVDDANVLQALPVWSDAVALLFSNMYEINQR